MTVGELSRLNSHPVYQPFVDAFQRAMSGLESPDAESVPVSDIVVPEGFWHEPGVAALLPDVGALYQRRRREGQRVWVLRRPDGTLWTYDDCHYVTALQRTLPDAIVPVWVMQHP